MPGPQIAINETPYGPKVPQFSGQYWPWMPLDAFEDAFYEVAEPLFTWVRDNWIGSLSDKPLLMAQIEHWWHAFQVPREHPVIGFNLEADAIDPTRATMTFVVAPEYSRLHQEMVTTRPNRLVSQVFDMGPPRPDPEAKIASETECLGTVWGWDDDPLAI